MAENGSGLGEILEKFDDILDSWLDLAMDSDFDWDRCPGSEEVVGYYEGRLSASTRQGIEHHLTVCRFCEEEIAMLTALGTEPISPPIPSPLRSRWSELLEYLKQAGKEMLDAIPRPAPQPAFAVRGGLRRQDIYQVDQYQITFGVTRPTLTENRWKVAGKIEEPASWDFLDGAILLFQDDTLATQGLVEDGYFTLEHVTPGNYTIFFEIPDAGIRLTDFNLLWTAEEMADLLLADNSPPDFQRLLEQLRPYLKLEVIQELKARVDGEMYRNASRALEIAEVAETVAEFIPNPEAKALALWAKGNPLHFLVRNQEALTYYQRAESIYAELQQQLKVAGLQLNQVAVLREMGKYQDALTLYKKTLITCQIIGPPAQRYLANLEMNIGVTYWLMGELTAALDAYERSYTLFASLPGGGQEARMAMIEINRANVLKDMDRFIDAESLYIRAREVLADASHDQEVARADLNLGVLAYHRGQYQIALRYLETARSGFAAIPNPVEAAMVDLERAIVYRHLNMFQETINLAADAERMFEQETNLWLQALALINQAVGHQRLHKYARAEEQFAKARGILQKQGAPSRILALDLDRAYLALQAGRLKAAQELAHEVKEQLDLATWPSLAARLDLLLAHCALASAIPNRTVARQHTEQALSIGHFHNLHEVTIAAHHLMGQILEGSGDLEGAWQAYYSAMEKIEWLRALLALDEFRLGFMEEKLPIYADAVRLSHKMASQATNGERAALAKVFYTLNLAVTAPLRRLRPVEESVTPDDQPLRKQLDQLREQWYWHQSKLEDVDRENSSHVRGRRVDLAASRQRLHELESQLAELMRRWQVRSTPLLEPQEVTKPFGRTPARIATTADEFLASVQARLRPQELLLQYYKVEGQVQALLVTQKEIHLVRNLIAVERIEGGRKAWHFDLEHTYPFAASPEAGREVANRHLYRFYNALVAPFEQRLTGCDKIFLLVPPDWHDLPVGAFFDRQRHLAQRVQLVYLSAPDRLLNEAGAGDFVLPAVEMAETSGETSREDVSKGSQALVIGYSDEGHVPHTLHEARQVAAMLTPHLPVTLLLEGEVSLARLQSAALDSRLLHLASHAVFRPDNPLFSWVRLADRHLTVAELYDEMRLPERPLVVLSACETGRGQARGGGLLGMGRGFMAAGANGLIVSLWKAPDQSSAHLMADFYTHLIQNSATPSAALHHAQQQAIARGYHPYHWAGFIFIQG